MAKIYIDTVKYTIYASFSVNGTVEKPDVVGAIFGQTEGLLGEELDLRELQKNGRIGRIEVEITSENNKSKGYIKIPSSLDIVETSIIASSLETIERVGPYEASIKVEKIEDNRNEKRRKMIERAKELLKKVLETQIPESKEIVELVKNELKANEIIEYGEEKLAAGPNIDLDDKIIVVEGRADVINLLKNDIKNVIALDGAKIPKTIIELSKKKEITVFLDGDRGGDIILKEMINNGVEIDYVARAPPGKEVEELTRKEIIKALRNKEPLILEKREEKEETLKQSKEKEEQKENALIEKEIKERLLKELQELKGTLKAKFLDEKLNVTKELHVKNLIPYLISSNNVYALVFDGVITQRLIDIAEEKNVMYIAGIKKSEKIKMPKKTIIISQY
jgi:DNA primase